MTSLAILKLSLGMAQTSKNQVAAPAPFSVLLAAFSVLLHKYTGEEDISVGSSSATSNPLVLRIKVAESDSMAHVVQTVLEVIS